MTTTNIDWLGLGFSDMAGELVGIFENDPQKVPNGYFTEAALDPGLFLGGRGHRL